MRRMFWFSMAFAGLVAVAASWWRRHPRFGAEWVNRVADPWLVRQGAIAGSKGELGLLEHIGRTTGIVRVTPVHPVRTADGFRIIVPLGSESQWARNVLAARHCRLQVGDVVHELDEPQLVLPSEVHGLMKVGSRVMEWLGFRYLLVRRFAERPGTLGELAPEAVDDAPAVPEPESEAEPAPPEAVPAT